MFARHLHLTDHEKWEAERKKIAAKAPHLALAVFNPDPPKPAEPEMFVWKDVGELFR
jgi:hypothetical protein